MKAKVSEKTQMVNDLYDLCIKEIGLPQLKFLKELRTLYGKYFKTNDPQEWMYTQHYGFGMKIRNLFRQAYSDAEMVRIMELDEDKHWDHMFGPVFNEVLDRIKLVNLV